MTLQVWQSKRKLGFETSRNMDLEKYVRACERASLDNTRLKEIFAKKTEFQEKWEREKKKWKDDYKTKHSVSFGLSSLFAFFLRSSSFVHPRRYQISFAFHILPNGSKFWFLPNRRKFWQRSPLGERDGLIPTNLKKNHQTFSLNQNICLLIFPLLDLPN